MSYKNLSARANWSIFLLWEFSKFFSSDVGTYFRSYKQRISKQALINGRHIMARNYQRQTLSSASTLWTQVPWLSLSVSGELHSLRVAVPTPQRKTVFLRGVGKGTRRLGLITFARQYTGKPRKHRAQDISPVTWAECLALVNSSGISFMPVVPREFALKLI